MLFANTLGDVQKSLLLRHWKKFACILESSVKSSKTKVILVNNQKTRNQALCTIMIHSVVWKTSYILTLRFIHKHGWNECATRGLKARKRPYHAFENPCNHGEIMCSVLKKYLFDTLVTLNKTGKLLEFMIPSYSTISLLMLYIVLIDKFCNSLIIPPLHFRIWIHHAFANMSHQMHFIVLSIYYLDLYYGMHSRDECQSFFFTKAW